MNWELCDVSNADKEFLIELHRLALDDGTGRRLTITPTSW